MIKENILKKIKVNLHNVVFETNIYIGEAERSFILFSLDRGIHTRCFWGRHLMFSANNRWLLGVKDGSGNALLSFGALTDSANEIGGQ